MKEALDYGKRKMKDFDVLRIVKPPKQPNIYDCGVCLCLNLELLSRVDNVSKLNYRSYKSDASSMNTERTKIREEIDKKQLRDIA